MTTEITTLPSGLRVVTAAMPSVETVSVGAWVGVGARHEPKAINGVAHLLEHMAFKGTKRRTALQIAEEIEAVGGHINAYTGREQTAYYAKVLKEDTALAVDILSDVLQHSLFDPEELARERAVVIQEIGQAEDTPDDIVFDHFQESAYPDQGLGRPVLGTIETVNAMDSATVAGYLARHYGADNMVVAASGNLDHARIVDMVGRAFDALPARGDMAAEPARYGGAEKRDPRDLEQVHLVLGMPGVAHHDPDFWAMSVFSTLFGGGMSSRLFQEVREKRGLVYAIHSFSASYGDGGLFGIYAGTGEKEIAELVPVVCDEFKRVAEDVAEVEIQRARAQIKAGLLMSLESTGARAEQLAHQLLAFGRTFTTAELVAKIEAVDRASVARLAARLLSGTPSLAAVGPLDRLEPLERIAERLH